MVCRIMRVIWKPVSTSYKIFNLWDTKVEMRQLTVQPIQKLNTKSIESCQLTVHLLLLFHSASEVWFNPTAPPLINSISLLWIIDMAFSVKIRTLDSPYFEYILYVSSSRFLYLINMTSPKDFYFVKWRKRIPAESLRFEHPWCSKLRVFFTFLLSSWFGDVSPQMREAAWRSVVPVL